MSTRFIGNEQPERSGGPAVPEDLHHGARIAAMLKEPKASARGPAGRLSVRGVPHSQTWGARIMESG